MASSDTPHLRGGRRRAKSAVLVLHGGAENSTMATNPLQLSYLRMLDLYAGLRQQSRSSAVYLLRFRVRGWNPGQAVPDPVQDARWALAQIAARHGDVPVALLGHSMGGRTAFAAAGEASVVGVCGLAPWLPGGEPLPIIKPGAKFVIAHGTGDRMTSAPLSMSYARRLRSAGGQVARFELPGARHALLDEPLLWHQFAVRTTLGLAGDRELPPAVAAALSSGSAGLDLALSSALGGDG